MEDLKRGRSGYPDWYASGVVERCRSSKILGLLIVDEEQRFGVGHKEKIKQLRE